MDNVDHQNTERRVRIASTSRNAKEIDAKPLPFAGFL